MDDKYPVEDIVETIGMNGGLFNAVSEEISAEEIEDPELAELWRQAEDKILELEPLFGAIEVRIAELEEI